MRTLAFRFPRSNADRRDGFSRPEEKKKKAGGWKRFAKKRQRTAAHRTETPDFGTTPVPEDDCRASVFGD